MKKLITFCLTAILSLSVYAITPNYGNSVSTLREAQNCYELKDYGKALKYAEDAILYRKQKMEYESKLLENSLASREVKKAGNNIDNVITILTEREEKECIDLINSYTKKKGIDFFNNNIQELLSYIKSQESFPEAYKLIADIYKLEGEYSIAEEYYLRALENEAVLDIPDDKYAILYQLADLSKLEGNYDKMEVRLLNIIGNSNVDRNKVVVKAMRNTISKNNKEAITKLFELYRSYDYYSLNAYCLLAKYYLSLNEYEKAFDYSVLSVITGYSKIDSLLCKRNLNYSFTTLEAYFDEIEYHSDIIEWGRDNDIWESYNLLSEICAYLGYSDFSVEFLKILAFHSPEKYWQQNAVLKLDIIDGIKNPD